MRNDTNELRIRHRFDTLFPELVGMPKEVRDHLAHVSRRRKVWLMPMWWLRWLYPMVIFVVCKLAYPYLPQDSRIVEWAGDAVSIALILLMVISIKPATRFYKKSLVHDEVCRLRIRIPICLLCDYDLRGTPDVSTACPECGATIAAVISDTNEST